MNYRFATSEDALLLAELNEQLIRDEGHRNPMSPVQLTDRMAGWLRAEYQAVVFEEGSSALGYALFRFEPDHVLLRQLFVLPDGGARVSHAMHLLGCGAMRGQASDACESRCSRPTPQPASSGAPLLSGVQRHDGGGGAESSPGWSGVLADAKQVAFVTGPPPDRSKLDSGAPPGSYWQVVVRSYNHCRRQRLLAAFSGRGGIPHRR